MLIPWRTFRNLCEFSDKKESRESNRWERKVNFNNNGIKLTIKSVNTIANLNSPFECSGKKGIEETYQQSVQVQCFMNLLVKMEISDIQ